MITKIYKQKDSLNKYEQRNQEKQKGIDYYNDTNATSPEAVIAAINAIGKNIILIAGGNDRRRYRLSSRG